VARGEWWEDHTARILTYNILKVLELKAYVQTMPERGKIMLACLGCYPTMLTPSPRGLNDKGRKLVMKAKATSKFSSPQNHFRRLLFLATL